MLVTYPKFNETQLPEFKYWPICVAALYAGGIIAVLALTIAKAHC